MSRRNTTTLVWLSETDDPQWFPPVSQALREPNGLLAAGGELSATRLIAAYEQGIFPWYSAGQPVLWWSPEPRAVFFPAEFHRSRSLQRTLRRNAFTTRLDTAFPAVIQACAELRADDKGTWLTPEMIAAYTELHRLGYAHSIETWRDDRLAGGVYGIHLGGVFYGESMFSRETDASKVALSRLMDESQARGIVMIDCQVASPHLQSLGSRSIPREEFVALLTAHCRPHRPGPWTSIPAAST